MPKKILEGVAIRDSKDKTVAVRVESKKLHKRYKKMVKIKKTYLVHDENNDIKSGVTVKIEEHKPFSKRKAWIVVQNIAN